MYALSRRPDTLPDINISSISDPDTSITHNNDTSDCSSNGTTIHSADKSNDYYIHYTTRPANFFRNQLVFKMGSTNSIIQILPFNNFRRTEITRNNFDSDSISQFITA